jgi:hypothetical protein
MESFKDLGAPAVEWGPLQIWVHGRAFPDSLDAWDGNWLRITARCSEAGASVTTSGVLLDAVSFFSWRSELQKMYECLQGEAVLDSHEPILRVAVTSRGQVGQITVRVEISPNMEQGHWFEFAADQTFLPPIVEQCDALLERFPVRRPAERGV